jgi:hypothetical protein
MDLKRLTVPELRQLAKNAQARNSQDILEAVGLELFDRGEARSTDLKHITWNQERVRSALIAFKEVASRVKSNKRTAYTEAGGLKIGLRKDHPDWLWVDTYSAIKTQLGNSVFYCYIKKPGQEPEFGIKLDEVVLCTYTPNELDAALEEWKKVALNIGT